MIGFASDFQDLPLLASLPEIDAVFDRASIHVENAPKYADIFDVELPREMGSYSTLLRNAGAEATAYEIARHVLADPGATDRVHALVLPDGRVLLTAHPDDRSGDTLQIALLATGDRASPDMIAALAHLLVGVCSLNASTRRTAPLASAEEWSERLQQMLSRNQIEEAFQVASKAATEARAKGPRRSEVVDDHLRWFARGASSRPAPPIRAAGRGGGRPRSVDLRDHILNMRHGVLSGSGLVSSTAQDVAHIARRARAFVDADSQRSVLVYGHGGLVSEQAALNYVEDTARWWLENGVFPVFCIWETDAMSSIFLALRQALGLTRKRGVQDWISNARDEATEVLVRGFGRPVWGAMKYSARRASEPGGGLSLLAAELDTAFDGADLPLHLVGHSAGSILLLHWLQVLRSSGRVPQTFQTLAPAATNRLYRDGLGPVATASTTRCRIYAMSDAAERADSCGAVYGKSLLYLVSRAFEHDGPVPISGMQRHLNADADLLHRLAAGNDDLFRETVIYSVPKRLADTVDPRLRSTAQTHGGFDNDAPTMEAVLRFARPGLPASMIVPFPAETRAARGAEAGFGGEDDMPPELRHYLSLVAGDSAPTALETPPITPARARSGGRHALSIGIDSYPDQPLSGCVNDSNLWSTWLGSHGFDVTQCTTPEATTRDAIATRLQDFVAAARSGDLLVWHFSGHGIEIEDAIGTAGDERGPCDQAIVGSYSTAGEDLIQHALIDDEIHNILSGLADGAELLVFLDCCFSGSGTRLAGGARVRSLGRVRRPGYRSRNMSLVGGTGARAANPYATSNHILFSAAMPEQLAQEKLFDGKTYGAFSHAVHRLLASPWPGVTNLQFARAAKSEVNLSTQSPNIYCAPERRSLPFPLAGV